MSSEKSGSSTGLLHSLTALAGTFVAIAYTRLELLSLDLEEERAHLLSLLLLSLVGLFCLGVGVVLVAVMLIVNFWDTHRMLAFGIISGAFLVLGAAAWAVALRRSKTRPKMFAGSLSTLSEDQRQLALRL